MKSLVWNSNLNTSKKKSDNCEVKKIYKEKLLLALFFISPFIDSLNGYCIRTMGIYGVGTFYHSILLIIMILLSIENKRIVVGEFEKIISLLIIVFGLSFAINSFLGTKATYISLNRSSKILCTAVILMCLYRLVKSNIINEKVIRKILIIQSTIIPLMVFLLNNIGIYNYAYQGSQSGKVGLYANLNELTPLLLIIIFFQISIIFEKFNIKNLMIIFICYVDLLFTESKTAFLVIAISIICVVLNILKMKKFKFKKNIFIFSILVLPSMVYFIIDFYEKIRESFISRQFLLFSAYGDQSNFLYLTSGRTGRFNELVLTPLYNLFNSSNLVDVLKGFVNIVFGNGFSTGYYEVFEMEIFDVFLYSGISGTIIFCIINILIIKKAKINSKYLINYVGLIIVMLKSFFSGYVWSGGIAGLYFSLYSVYLMCYTKMSNSEKNI